MKIMCSDKLIDEPSDILKLIWIEKVDGQEPSNEINEQIFDMICENQEDIDEELADSGAIAMFGEIDDCFLMIEMGKDNPDHVLISHLEQDDWLDHINASKIREKDREIREKKL